MSRLLRSFVLGAAIAVALAGPAAAFDFHHLFHHGPRGNGELTSVSYDLKTCSEVTLKCGLDIDVTIGPQQKITLLMDKNLVAHYEIEARDGVLVIDADKNPRPSRGAGLEVTLTELDRLTVDGAGDISIRGYDGDQLTLTVDGAGDLKVDGKVGEVVLSVNGAGDIDARRLESRTADVAVNGAGDIAVWASERAKVEINGVGDVDVYGDPADFAPSVHGIGDISRR